MWQWLILVKVLNVLKHDYKPQNETVFDPPNIWTKSLDRSFQGNSFDMV